MDIIFSANQNEEFSSFYTDFGYGIDLSEHGYELAKNGMIISQATPKLSYVEIEGADGKIDVTKALTEDIKYNNRDVSIKFVKWETSSMEHLENENIVNSIFDGSQRKLIVGDWYLEGSFTVNSSLSAPLGYYEIIGDCKPYRMNLKESSKTFTVSGTSESFINYADRLIVCPMVNVSADMELTLRGAVYALQKGDNMIPDLLLKKGTNTFTLSGNGIATFTWRGGNL